MPDYDADPLWDDESGVMVPLSDLPISESLKQRLIAWRKRWEEINDEAIRTDDFDTPDADHRRDEKRLWMALREELGPGYQVGMTATEQQPNDTRVHVIWEPGAEPELPIWHQRSEPE